VGPIVRGASMTLADRQRLDKPAPPQACRARRSPHPDGSTPTARRTFERTTSAPRARRALGRMSCTRPRPR
jgi:hypothetical protein